MAEQETKVSRYERFKELVGDQELYDGGTRARLDAGGEIPRYALGTCEDAYPGNVNWTLHDTVAQLAASAQLQANEYPAWTPKYEGIVDLDTGKVGDYRVHVEIVGL